MADTFLIMLTATGCSLNILIRKGGLFFVDPIIMLTSLASRFVPIPYWQPLLFEKTEFDLVPISAFFEDMFSSNSFYFVTAM